MNKKVEEYIYKIRPYIKDVVIDPEKSDKWKMQLKIALNFMPSKDNDKQSVMDSRSDGIEIMINDKSNEIIEELFQSLLSRYQIGLETSIGGSDFIFDFAHLLYYKCHKIDLKYGGS